MTKYITPASEKAARIVSDVTFGEKYKTDSDGWFIDDVGDYREGAGYDGEYMVDWVEESETQPTADAAKEEQKVYLDATVVDGICCNSLEYHLQMIKEDIIKYEKEGVGLEVDYKQAKLNKQAFEVVLAYFGG